MGKVKCGYIDSDNSSCGKDSRYWSYLIVRNETAKSWVGLCGTCDKREGRSSLMSLGWSKDDSMRQEREPGYTPFVLEKQKLDIPAGFRGSW